MSFNTATATYETTVGVFPGWIMIDTSDSLATVMGVGYLNGRTLSPFGIIGYTPQYTTGQMALVSTADSGTVMLMVDVNGGDTNLIAPIIA